MNQPLHCVVISDDPNDFCNNLSIATPVSFATVTEANGRIINLIQSGSTPVVVVKDKKVSVILSLMKNLRKTYREEIVPVFLVLIGDEQKKAKKSLKPDEKLKVFSEEKLLVTHMKAFHGHLFKISASEVA